MQSQFKNNIFHMVLKLFSFLVCFLSPRFIFLKYSSHHSAHFILINSTAREKVLGEKNAKKERKKERKWHAQDGMTWKIIFPVYKQLGVATWGGAVVFLPVRHEAAVSPSCLQLQFMRWNVTVWWNGWKQRPRSSVWGKTAGGCFNSILLRRVLLGLKANGS